MSTSMLLGMFDWIGDFFKALFDLIPKVVYLLYASIACVLDVLQLFFRKLAGLDVYYIEGEAVTGDLVTNFIAGILGIKFDGSDKTNYGTLSTVFWSFVIFGVIICFASTLVAVIKSHYSYDDKAAKGPMQYVYTAGKAIINMAAVPIIVVLGLYLSQAILTAIDSITSTSSSSLVNLYGADKVNEYLQPVNTVKGATGKSDEKTYIFYDIFGFGGAILYGNNTPSLEAAKKIVADDLKVIKFIGASNQTFSGSLFKVAAYNGNRARLGQMGVKQDKDFWGNVGDALIGNITFTGSEFSDMSLFGNAQTNQELADMIDTAFACNLHVKEFFFLDYDFGDIVSMKYFTNYLTIGADNFSKFNVGLVWYYYDLWNFNFIVGFGAIIVCVSIFINIILGLITRLFMCIALFLVAPPLFGLAPLDGGGAAKRWRETFMKQVLMTYGAVLGMNIMFLILPYINRIDFFNIKIADYFAQTLIIIVGLITIKALIGTMSSLVGGEDANKSGEGIKEEVGSTMGKAAAITGGLAKGVAKYSLGGVAAKKIMANTKSAKAKDAAAKAQENLGRAQDSKDQAAKDWGAEQDKLKEMRENGASEEEIAAQRAIVGEKYEAYSKASDELSKAEKKSEAATNAYHNTRGYKAAQRVAKVKDSKFGKTLNKGFSSALGTFGSTLMGDKGIKAVKDSIWKPEDYAKTTAKNTADLLDAVAGKKDEGGKRSGGLAGNVSGMREDVSGMRGDMHQGFVSTNKNLRRVNKNVVKGNESLGNIEHNTDETRKGVRTIQSHTKQIKDETYMTHVQTTKSANALQQALRDNQEAKKDREKALKDQQELLKKTEEIAKNTKPKK